ncbi:MAG: hypothetical protein ABEJ82_05065 [Haloplanus sp.]
MPSLLVTVGFAVSVPVAVVVASFPAAGGAAVGAVVLAVLARRYRSLVVDRRSGRLRASLVVSGRLPRRRGGRRRPRWRPPR